MLDVIFEKLRYTIDSEWTEGQAVAVILETSEDVRLDTPERLTDVERQDDLLVEMWKENVKQHVSELRALLRAKKKLYSTVWKLLSKIMKNKVSGQEGFVEKDAASDVVWLVTTVRSLVTDFDNAAPKVLSTLETMSKILTYQQTERMENADYVKSLLALVKVYEQYCGAFGVSIKQAKEINGRVEAATDEKGSH